MRKFEYNLISFTLVTLLVIWILLIFTLALVFQINYNNNEIYKIILYSFFIVTSILIIFITLLVVSKKGKYFIKENSSIESRKYKSKIENQKIKELSNKDYSTLKEYKGKELFTIRRKAGFYLIWAIYVFITIYIFFLDLVGNSDVSVFMFAWLLPSLSGMIGYSIMFFSTKVKITSDGICLLKNNRIVRVLKWEKVRTIGISTNAFGANTIFAYMYITTKKIDANLSIVHYEEKGNIVSLKPRAELIHCILKYWDGEIVNLDTQKSWLKYINNL